MSHTASTGRQILTRHVGCDLPVPVRRRADGSAHRDGDARACLARGVAPARPRQHPSWTTPSPLALFLDYDNREAEGENEEDEEGATA